MLREWEFGNARTDPKLFHRKQGLFSFNMVLFADRGSVLKVNVVSVYSRLLTLETLVPVTLEYARTEFVSGEQFEGHDCNVPILIELSILVLRFNRIHHAFSQAFSPGFNVFVLTLLTGLCSQRSEF